MAVPGTESSPMSSLIFVVKSASLILGPAESGVAYFGPRSAGSGWVARRGWLALAGQLVAHLVVTAGSGAPLGGAGWLLGTGCGLCCCNPSSVQTLPWEKNGQRVQRNFGVMEECVSGMCLNVG